jgi:hypothetical protein
MFSLKDSVGSVTNRGPVVVFVVITILLIAAIVVFIAYRLWRRDLQTAVVLRSPRKLFGTTEPGSLENSKIPSTVNGQEFSFSFWIYISEFTSTTNYKLVFQRGGTPAAVTNTSSPIVFLDKSTNRMFISVRSSHESAPTFSLDTIAARGNLDHMTAIIDYVPLQRWVHYAFVVQDNLLTVFQDGDVYTVENVHDLTETNHNSAAPGVRPFIKSTTGNITWGPLGTNTSETRGYICNLYFFNYALTSKDVRSIYEFGPVSTNVLSRLGIPEYGIRSPIYRVED